VVLARKLPGPPHLCSCVAVVAGGHRPIPSVVVDQELVHRIVCAVLVARVHLAVAVLVSVPEVVTRHLAPALGGLLAELSEGITARRPLGTSRLGRSDGGNGVAVVGRVVNGQEPG